MPPTYVQIRHDDGRWYRAELLGQHRSGGRWRVVVRYSVAPGMQYQRALWADEARRLGNPPPGPPVGRRSPPAHPA